MNCYDVVNGQEAVLIDAGVSCRETERRMMRMGLRMKSVKAIFITHEHGDHIRGAEVISRKFNIPVYITEKTYTNSRMRLHPQMFIPFEPHQVVKIGNLTVSPFPKWHDAVDPHSFTVSSNGFTAGVFTDIGTVCEHVAKNLNLCNAVFLEANYDEEMLENGRYPAYLKNRIRGMEGHLSNDQALELFTTHGSDGLQLLVLSHISAENNRPDLVHDLFTRHANGIRVVVASRYEESEVFQIH